MGELDPEFFEEWKIDGVGFFQLNEPALKIMGMTDRLLIVSEISKKQRSEKDLCCWLALKGMSHLIDIFKTYHIDGKTLLTTSVDILKALEITMPQDIFTLMEFIQNSN